MRKVLPILAFAFLLTACGGGSAAPAVACVNAYWDGTVGTCLPTGWHVVDRAALDQRGVPAEVVVAFQSDAPYAGQFATVTVTRETLSKQMTSKEYSDASVQSVGAMPGYQDIDQTKATVDDDTVALHTFTAQPRTDEPKTRFAQVSAATGMNGYTFTAATPVSVDSTLGKQIQLILSNITLKGPASSTKN